MTKIPEVIYDVAAFDACRKNNSEQCAQGIQIPKYGGNVPTLHQLVGGPVPAEEFTIASF